MKWQALFPDVPDDYEAVLDREEVQQADSLDDLQQRYAENDLKLDNPKEIYLQAKRDNFASTWKEPSGMNLNIQEVNPENSGYTVIPVFHAQSSNDIIHSRVKTIYQRDLERRLGEGQSVMVERGIDETILNDSPNHKDFHELDDIKWALDNSKRVLTHGAGTLGNELLQRWYDKLGISEKTDAHQAVEDIIKSYKENRPNFERDAAIGRSVMLPLQIEKEYLSKNDPGTYWTYPKRSEFMASKMTQIDSSKVTLYTGTYHAPHVEEALQNPENLEV
ncbi:MAG: hypothetical protein ABEJ72_01780 [Candidatus Aenigmatarchaeota archaeon]